MGILSNNYKNDEQLTRWEIFLNVGHIQVSELRAVLSLILIYQVFKLYASFTICLHSLPINVPTSPTVNCCFAPSKNWHCLASHMHHFNFDMDG